MNKIFLDARPSKSNTFYRVIAGSYTERKNADAQLAKKAGYNAFIDVYQK